MIILGIGGIGGDAACAILRDGQLTAAVEESKLVRHQGRPGGAGGTSRTCDLPRASPWPEQKAEQVDAVALVRPMPSPDFHLNVRSQFPGSRVVVLEHHLAHAASAYYASPFEEATVLVADARRRRALRIALAGPRGADEHRRGTIRSGFPGRIVWPRDRAVGLCGQRR